MPRSAWRLLDSQRTLRRGLIFVAAAAFDDFHTRLNVWSPPATLELPRRRPLFIVVVRKPYSKIGHTC